MLIIEFGEDRCAGLGFTAIKIFFVRFYFQNNHAYNNG